MSKRQLKVLSWFTKGSPSKRRDSCNDKVIGEDNSMTITDDSGTKSSDNRNIENKNISLAECNRSSQRQTEFLDVRGLEEPFQPENYSFPKTIEKGNNYGRSCQSSYENVIIDNFSTRTLIEKRDNRRALLEVISNIRHLSRQ